MGFFQEKPKEMTTEAALAAATSAIPEKAPTDQEQLHILSLRRDELRKIFGEVDHESLVQKTLHPNQWRELQAVEREIAKLEVALQAALFTQEGGALGSPGSTPPVSQPAIGIEKSADDWRHAA